MKYYILLIVVFVVNYSKANDSLLLVAKQYADNSAYELAALLCEKAAFESTHDSAFVRALIQKNQYQRANGDLDAANQSLLRVFPKLRELQTNELHIAYYYQSALNHYLLNQNIASLAQLDQLSFFDAKIYLQDYLFLSLLNHLALGDTASFQQNLTPYLASSNGTSCLQNHPLPKWIKTSCPKKAKIWSYVLPGSGQMMVGKIGMGTASLLLNSGTIWFIIKSIFTKHYLAATFIGLPVFSMLYIGGAQLAEKIAIKKNQHNLEAFKTAWKARILCIENQKMTTQ